MGKQSLSAIIVDDDSIIREVLRVTLKRIGIIVEAEAGDANAADSALGKSSPDMVFLDIVLPGESGFSVLKKIKSENPKTRVIMISGESGANKVKKAIESGAQGYIVKPFTPDKVIKAIQSVFPAFKIQE
ncbi:MAG: response regulator [Gammaproteobacteria bacterium]|nr:response regulator [Gammaproteobacteria bacterium]MDH5594447.1 response regulator [Gammaproteobacteria bacterium]